MFNNFDTFAWGNVSFLRLFFEFALWNEGAIVCLLGLRFSLPLNREYFAAFSRVLAPRHAYVLTFRLTIRWWNANIFEVFFIVGFKWLQNKFFAYGLLRNHNNIISNKNLFSFFHVEKNFD